MEWTIIVMLAIILILNLINKFPIIIEIKENKQTWEANCNCECIEQTPKCNFWAFRFNSSRPKGFYVNYTLWNFTKSQECRTCWLEPETEWKGMFEK